MTDKYARLSKTRRKRAVPDGWVTSEALQTFKGLTTSASVSVGARSLSLDTSSDLALVGGTDGRAGVYSISQNKILLELFDVASVGGVTDSLWAGRLAVFATSSGEIKIFDNGSEVSKYHEHRGEVAALALHPSKEILASVGTDKSYILYDLTTSTKAMQVFTDSSKKYGFRSLCHLLTTGRLDDGSIPSRRSPVCGRWP
jgi:pre-mRNA-processing factor 19